MNKYLYKNELEYFIIRCTSKNINKINWFIENFNTTIKSHISFDGSDYRQSFKIDKMETWKQTKEYITKAINSYEDLIISITPIYKTISKI